tara:strand:- start:14255 stop:15859 length:1605 start_codon:yes stop_codon:yes gene_type:complete
MMKPTSDSNKLKLLVHNLALAPQDLSQLSFAKTTIPALHRFVRRLPQSATDQIQQVYSAIKEVSQLNALPTLKLAILDILAQPIRESIEILTEKTHLNQQTYTAVSLALAMLKYQAMGYKSVLITASGDETSQRTELQKPIRASLEAMNALYLHSLIFYVSLPKDFWHELHIFYRLIKLLQLENTPLFATDKDSASTHRPTLLSLYLKPLLLSATNPGQYTPVEIKKIALFLDQWASMAQLAPSRTDGLYVIDLDSDTGPHYEDRFGALTSNHIRLQTNQLVNLIGGNFYQTEPGTRFVPLPTRLVDSLCNSWGQAHTRQHQHVLDQSDVEVLIGFTMIHDKLTEQADLPRSTQQQNDVVSLDKVKTETSANACGVKRTGCWGKLRNASQAGIQLSLNDPANRIAPGDFVCYRTDADDSWSLGLVRWLNVSTGLKQVAGIKTLSHQVEPCSVKLMQDGRPMSPFLPGLRFIDHTNPDSLRLATLPKPFRVQNTITLVTQTNEQSLRLVELCESTFHIAVFCVETTSEYRSNRRD